MRWCGWTRAPAMPNGSSAGLETAMPFPPGTDDFFSAAKTARVATGLAVNAAARSS